MIVLLVVAWGAKPTRLCVAATKVLHLSHLQNLSTSCFNIFFYCPCFQTGVERNQVRFSCLSVCLSVVCIGCFRNNYIVVPIAAEVSSLELRRLHLCCRQWALQNCVIVTAAPTFELCSTGQPMPMSCIEQRSSTRGIMRPEKFWNTQFLNKIRADFDKLVEKNTMPDISLIKTGYNAVS
jgi:hypothetical protein